MEELTGILSAYAQNTKPSKFKHYLKELFIDMPLSGSRRVVKTIKNPLVEVISPVYTIILPSASKAAYDTFVNKWGFEELTKNFTYAGNRGMDATLFTAQVLVSLVFLYHGLRRIDKMNRNNSK